MHKLLFHVPGAIAALLLASPLLAQDPPPGVRIGLTYQMGVKPGVIVLPVIGPGGDSMAVMIRRNLDFGDRITVIGPEATDAAAVARASAGGAINHELFGRLGAAAVVQLELTATGVRASVHDVGERRVARTEEFPLAAGVASAEWRMAVHVVSDELERWITGVRGIAATRVLFVRAGRVHVIDADGANERVVTDEQTAMSPAWHPDGRYIAYTALGDDGSRIHVRDLATGQVRRLIATPVGLNITPAFSPDGGRIVYAHGADVGTDLVVAAPFETSPARRITVTRGAVINIAPSFSPDGRRIAFMSDRSGPPEVYIMDADGTNPELLTPFAFGDQNYRAAPDWSPDGRTVAFMSQLGGRFQVMTITLRDRRVTQLTSDGENEDPSWAPDGRHLVFTSTRTGRKELFVLDVESGRTRQLTRGGGTRIPAWSPHLGRAP